MCWRQFVLVLCDQWVARDWCVLGLSCDSWHNLQSIVFSEDFFALRKHFTCSSQHKTSAECQVSGIMWGIPKSRPSCHLATVFYDSFVWGVSILIVAAMIADLSLHCALHVRKNNITQQTSEGNILGNGRTLISSISNEKVLMPCNQRYLNQFDGIFTLIS